MTWFLKARNAMILVLSWATAMAPLQAQAMTPQKFDMYKKAIESSGLAGAKPVKLRDFYRQHQAKFPRQMQFEIENYLKQNPNADAPKLTVTKVKNRKGTDDIRVLISFNGANQTVTIIDDGTNFMQVGSATLKYSDFYNPTKLFSKVEKAINMKPDSWRSLPKSMTTPFRMATFDQMQKMNLATRTEYIKSIQDLLVTMEKMVPGEAPRAPASKGKKTSSLDESVLREINFFMSVIVGRAEADGGPGFSSQGCVAAGWPAEIGQNSSGRTVCRFPAVSRDRCSAGTVRCNPDIFGSAGCVSEANDATAQCNMKADEKQMAMEFSGAVAEAKAQRDQAAKEASWNQFRQRIEGQIAELQAVCNSQFSISEISMDQAQTCEQMSARLSRVQSYSCANSEFKTAHAEICESPAAGGVAGPTPPHCECPGQEAPAPAPPAAGLPPSPTTPDNSCIVTPPPAVIPPTAGATRPPTAQVPSSQQRKGGCIESGEQGVTESTLTCNEQTHPETRQPRCPSGQASASCQVGSGPKRFRCQDPVRGGTDTSLVDGGGQESGSRSERSSGRSGESAWAKWKPWLMLGGVVLAGYFVMDWAWKQADRAAEQRIPPTPQPPVTVPAVPPFGGVDTGP